MSAREEILSAIRAAAVPSASVPSAPATDALLAPSSHILMEQFLRALTQVGGRGLVLERSQSLDDAIAQVRTDLGTASGSLLVLHGLFAVAENGAVYVDEADLNARTDVVLPEHLVIVVPAGAVVANLHEAMPLIPRHSACGWFLSGPSKTADIEQALVVGAQGSRTVHVILESLPT